MTSSAAGTSHARCKRRSEASLGQSRRGCLAAPPLSRSRTAWRAEPLATGAPCGFLAHVGVTRSGATRAARPHHAAAAETVGEPEQRCELGAIAGVELDHAACVFSLQHRALR